MTYSITDDEPRYTPIHGVGPRLFDRSALYTLAHNLQVGAALCAAHERGYSDGWSREHAWSPGTPGDVFPGWRPNVDGKGV